MVDAGLVFCCAPVASDDLAATTRDGIPAEEVYRVIDALVVYRDRHHTPHQAGRRSARASVGTR